MPAHEDGFVPLFDGRTLAGWHPAPRVYGAEWPGGPDLAERSRAVGLRLPEHPELHPAVWTVEDGAVVGRQDAPGSGYGGYLVSDEAYGDFELVLEMKPDWPADTGVMVRRLRDSWEGFQVLVDHRESGSIGGFFGNGLASFHAVPFALAGRRDEQGRVVGLVPDDPERSVEPFTPQKRALLRRAGVVEDFLAAWRWADWNELRVRCVGALPTITTWVNGVLVAELDTAHLVFPHYDPEAVLAVLGRRGHLAFEVHDNDERFGEARWGAGAACRWRHIRLKDLSGQQPGS